MKFSTTTVFQSFALLLHFLLSCSSVVSVSSELLTTSSTNTQQEDGSMSSTRRNLRGEIEVQHITGGPAIAVLSTNSERDISELCLALKSLRYLEGEDKSKKAPVLVFNEGDLSASQIEFIQNCAVVPNESLEEKRIVAFPYVSLNAYFPKGFDPEQEWEDFQKGPNYFMSLEGRQRWSYAQMIRFWTTGMWKHPAIQQFDTIMRIDTDSCFLENASVNFSSLPNLPSSQIVYMSINPPHGAPTYVKGLYDFAFEYMERHQLSPKNKQLWQIVEEAHTQFQTLPVFKTNFEICSRKFFQSPEVMQWHESLTELEPFGVWRGRWGDAQTRFLTMAMFTTEEQVYISETEGYLHGRGLCVEKLSHLMQE